MGWLQNIKLKMTKTGFWILTFLLGIYFTLNAVFGERGLQKLIYLQKEVAHARNIADHYRRNKETLDQQVKATLEFLSPFLWRVPPLEM